MFVEVLLIVVVYGVGILVIWCNYGVFDIGIWYVIVFVEGVKFLFVGFWYVYVSLLIY